MKITELADVVFSAGRVFDGLAADLDDTREFLRTGDIDGIASRLDLALLEDLRDLANCILTNQGPVDAAFVKQLNAQITRSGSLEPGVLRRNEQNIGVDTVYGRHEPKAVTDETLQALIDQATASADVTENALDLFVELAKAQPFGDGNKRTAIFAANGYLIRSGAQKLLTVPTRVVDGVSQARQFNEFLALAYMRDEHAPIKALLRENGFVKLTPTVRDRRSTHASKHRSTPTPSPEEDQGLEFG